MYVLQIVLALLRKNVDIHIILTSTFKGHLIRQCIGLPACPALRHINLVLSPDGHHGV